MKTMVKILAATTVLLFLVAEGARMDLSGTQSRDPHIPIATVKPRDLVIEVNTLGVMDAAEAHMVTSTLSNARIIHIVDDGSRVTAGDILVKLDPTKYKEEIERLEGDCRTLEAAVAAKEQLLEWEKNQVEKEIQTAAYRIRVARLNLEQIRKGEGPLQLAQMEEQVKEARQERDRYKAYLADLKRLESRDFDFSFELARAGQKLSRLDKTLASCQAKYVNYRDHMLPALIEKGKAEVEQALTELEQTRKGGTYKIAQARAALEEIRGRLKNTAKSLQMAEKKHAETIIRAPSAGIVILYEAFREGTRRKPRIGDVILQNQPILYLPDISAMVVKSRIREVDLHKVHVGQTCQVFVDAYPGDAYKGRVDFIGSLATADRQSGEAGKYFHLTIGLKSANERLRPGMTARVSILTEQVANALTLPVHAVFEDNQQRYCYRLSGREFERVDISVGRKNIHFAEITHGLEAGEQVSLGRPSDFGK